MDWFRLSEELVVLRDFLARCLHMRPGLPTYERMYQLSQRVAFGRASGDCARAIRKILRVFSRDAAGRLSQLDVRDVGEGVCGFERHWNRLRELFRKIFHPVMHGEALDRLFDRLLGRFIGDVQDPVSRFLVLSIEEDLDMDEGEAVCTGTERPCEMFRLAEFSALPRRARIVMLTALLRRLDWFDMFFERIAAHLVSRFREETRGLGLPEIRVFVDRQRGVEYLRDSFYVLESRFLRETVGELADEDVFGMFRSSRETRLCVDFFCIAGEEQRFVDIVGRYYEETMRDVCVEGFFSRYYSLDLEFRVLGSGGDGRSKEIRDGVVLVKRRAIEADAELSRRGVWRYLDGMMRGKVLVGEVGDEIDAGRVLESFGLEEMSLESWRGYLLGDVFRTVGEIFYLCENKDAFEAGLRLDLANRLLSCSVDVEGEMQLACAIDVGGTYSHRMRCMLKDFSEREVFLDAEILCLRMCRWPEYRDAGPSIPDVQRIRVEYEKRLGTQRKRVRWMDVLSSCDVEVFGTSATITLIQYSLLDLLAAGPRRPEELQICEFWKIHLDILVENGLVVVDGEYSLNEEWNAGLVRMSFIPESFQLEKGVETRRAFDEKDSLRAVLDCQIVRTMKRRKAVWRDALRDEFEKYPQSLFDEEIASLAGRGFLGLEGEEIRYLP